MRAIEKVNFYFATYGKMIVALFNFRLWPPFLIYLLVMALILTAVISMFSSLLSGWVIPIIFFILKLPWWYVMPDPILHYPQHLAYLPLTFDRLNVIPSLLLESLFTATAILMFVAYFRGERVGFSTNLRTASKFYMRILVVWLVNVVLVILLFRLLPQLFHDFVGGSPRREMALMLGMQALTVLLLSLFVYAIPYLLIRNRSLWASFTGSFNLFFKNFFTTYFFVGLPQFITLFLIIPLQNTNTIVSKFNPEVIMLMTYGLIVLLTLVNFFTTGSIVRFFLEVSED